MLEHSPGRCSPGRLLLQTTLNKVLEHVAPLDPIIGLIFQFRNWLGDDIRKKIDQTGARLHLGAVGGEREAMLRNLQQCHAQRPDVRGDGVGLALDPLGRHVVGGANEGVGVSFGAEFAADAKVAEFDLAVAAEQDVGGFDV